jgi:hypothetical protein
MLKLANQCKNWQLRRRITFQSAKLPDKKSPMQLMLHQAFRIGIRITTERPGFDITQIHKLFLNLILGLKASEFKDLARLEDVLKLHGFLPSFGAP